MREINVATITQNIKEMCIEANHFLTDDMKKDDFVINGVHYFWMTISEMQKDSNIMTKNMDVVDFVNETIISRS